jgi:hypothetical protein
MADFDKSIQFGSLDNQHDPLQVGADNLVIAANVDLMDNKACQRRDGLTATGLTGSDLHSLWANQAEDIGMILDGASLSQLDTNLSPTVVGNMPSSDTVSFEEITNVIACVSAAAIRFVSGAAFVSFALGPDLDGETEFKALNTTWPGGNCVAYFNGHFLVGTDTGILFSDSYSIGQHDTRDFVLPVPFPVKHILVVDTGIWICGWKKIVFLKGESIKEMNYSDIINVGVLTAAYARRGEFKGNDRVAPIFVALTDTGVFLLEEGSMTSLSDETYRPPVVLDANAIVRDINGAKQFISSFTYVSDRHIYKNKSMTIDTEEG